MNTVTTLPPRIWKPTADEVAQIAAHQGSLTKAGKPRKRRAKA